MIPKTCTIVFPPDSTKNEVNELLSRLEDTEGKIIILPERGKPLEIQSIIAGAMPLKNIVVVEPSSFPFPDWPHLWIGYQKVGLAVKAITYKGGYCRLSYMNIGSAEYGNI